MLDPIQVCEKHNILIVAEDLGNVCGFYRKDYGQSVIHININCSKEKQRYTIQYLLEQGYLINPDKMKFVRCEQLEQS